MAERELAQRDPFYLIESGHLHIKTKAGELVPFVLNKAQRKLHNIIKKLWFDNKIIRIIILKARQLGMSTYIEALIYSITSQTENTNSIVIADDKDGSNYIFDMSRLFQEKCPEYLKPEIKRSNEKKLEFDGIHSQILIDTAENSEAGRKMTLRAVHLSEKAFFPKRNADEIMLGLSHSVPPLPRTLIVQETTANGFNAFKDEWDAAVDGETDYIPIFIPWYWGEDYMMPAPEGFVIGDPNFGEISQDEPFLYEQIKKECFDRIEDRLQWRRWDIKNNCKGDIDKFRQENPSTPEEAFIASGECFFDKRSLTEQLKSCGEPLFKANIVWDNEKFVLRPCADGDFWFYEQPDPRGQYCIGGDACSGSGLDFAALVARNKLNNEVACVYHAKCDPDELAQKARALGSFLNYAIVAIENDKFGFSANEKLRKIYTNIYIVRKYEKMSDKMIEKFGWETNAKTRPLMLGYMQEEIREKSLSLNYNRLIRECLTFIKNPDTKKAEAESGMNDDLVLACAISGIVRRDNPYDPPRRAEGQSLPTTVDNV